MIPEKYYVPLLKSPQHIKGIMLNVESARFFAFNCHKTKKELSGQNESRVVSYIKWGEKQVTREKGKVKAGIPWPQVATVKNRKPAWYSMPLQRPTQQFMFYGYNDRFVQPFSNNSKFLADRRLHFVYSHAGVDPLKLAIILNATLTALFIELQGRISMSAGALDYATMDAKKTMILDPKLLNCKIDTPQIFFRKKIFNIFEECGIDPKSDVPIEEQEPSPMPDRTELDKIIFDAIGLAEDERKEVYRSYRKK